MRAAVELGAPGRQRLLALSLAMLLPSLGISIANVALPALAADFDVPFQRVQWVVIAYLLALTATIVAAGRLGDMIGRRRLLLAGIAIFTLASLAGMVAPWFWVLVLIRGVQGVGAAVMMALTVALVGDTVPKVRIGGTMGLLGSVSAAGTALGPSLGGVLVAFFGWPAVFAAMAAAGASAFLMGQRLFPPAPAAEPPQSRPDIAGTVLLALALAAFALATTRGAAAGGSMSGVLAALSAVLLAAFGIVEMRAPAPVVDLALLRDGTLSAALVSLGLVSAIVMATLVVGPFYLSQGLGLDPAAVGLVMSVGPGVAALAGFPGGRLVDRYGAAVVTVLGLSGVALGSGLMLLLPPATGVAGYVGSLAVLTAGYAVFQAANTTAVMTRAAPDRRGVMSGLLGLARNLGLITGASAMAALFALGSRGVQSLGLAPGSEAGLQLTFGVSAGLGGFALAITGTGLLRRVQLRRRSDPLP